MAAYSTKFNDFLTALANKMAFQEVYTKAYEHPLAIFKKGAMPLGYTGEFVHVNPANLTDYTRPKAPAFTNPFTAKDPTVFTDYLTVNEDKIASTLLSDDYLTDAFTSYEKFYDMNQAIVSSLYSGNAIYELGLVRSTISSGFGDTVRAIENIVLPTDEASAQSAILTIQNASSAMTEPSTNYVASDFDSAVSFVDPENQIILVKNSFRNGLKVYARAYAYNLDNLDFMPEMIGTESIGTVGGREIVAVIMDKAAVQIRDKVFRVDSIYNPADGTLNYWLRRRTLSGFLGFANAIAFAIAA